MLTLLILLLLLIVAIAAPLVGIDSTDDIDNPEWERRRSWRTTWD